MATRKRRSLLGSADSREAGDVPAPDATPASGAPREYGAPPPDSKPPAIDDFDPITEPATEPMEALDPGAAAAQGFFAPLEPGETIIPKTINEEDDDFGTSDGDYRGARFGGVVYEEVGHGTPPPAPRSAARDQGHHEVAEVPYVGSGGAPNMDTTDAGWGSIPMMRSPLGNEAPSGEDPGADDGEYPVSAPFVPSPDRYKLKQPTGDIWRAGATREATPPPSRGRTPGGARPRRGQPFSRTGDPFEDAPPTEEVPIGGMMADMSTSIGGPVSMPDLPSVFDLPGGSKAPKAESGGGGARTGNRPAYLADEPEPPPAPKPRAAPKPTPAADDEPAFEERGRGMTVVALGAAALAVLSIVVIIGVGAVVLFGDKGTATADLPAEVAPAAVPTRRGSQVPVRGDMKTAPEPAQVVPVDVAPVAEVGELPAPAPVVPAPAPAPAPAPVAAPAPAPVAAPPPKPAPAPKPAAAEATTGTLKIKSNRRVLVYVNGAPVGYAPTDYKGKPGAYTVSAMVPGQPETKQTKDAKIDAAGANATVNFTF